MVHAFYCTYPYNDKSPLSQHFIKWNFYYHVNHVELYKKKNKYNMKTDCSLVLFSLSDPKCHVSLIITLPLWCLSIFSTITSRSWNFCKNVLFEILIRICYFCGNRKINMMTKDNSEVGGFLWSSAFHYQI